MLMEISTYCFLTVKHRRRTAGRHAIHLLLLPAFESQAYRGTYSQPPNSLSRADCRQLIVDRNRWVLISISGPSKNRAGEIRCLRRLITQNKSDTESECSA